MTTATQAAETTLAPIAGWARSITTPTPARRLLWAIQDTWVITQRDLRRVARKPEVFAGELLMPLMFLLLFNFVFGGAIGAGTDVDYTQFLVPAIIVMTVLIGATQTGAGLAEDLSQGVVDRFRSLPMSGVAVLAGRTVSDTLRNVAAIALVTAFGYMLGFRFEAGVPAALLAIVVAVALGFAISWLVAVLATVMRNAEAVQMANMLWLLPMWFASSLFTPTETMPGWLQAFANHQPVSVAADAVRALSVGSPAAGPVLQATLWVVALLLVFMPLAVVRYRRSTQAAS